MTKYLITTAALLGLAACSSGEQSAADFEMAEDAAMDVAAPEGAQMASSKEESDNTESANATPGEIPVSKPQIAYSYDYGFRLSAGDISTAQQAHITLCNGVPQNGCRVLNMSNSGSEGDYANGMLHLEVAAAKAPVFGSQLAKVIDDSGGSQISASITGEDLSKRIVDTEARLRSRTLLSQRLTELLRTKKGTVAELVAAERAVTQVNEEIDQARSWLKEMRGRISYSKVMVNYASSAPGSGGFIRPIREAFSGIASTLGFSVGALITMVGVLLPWILLLSLGIYLRRRFKSSDRTFFGKEIEQEPAPTED